MAGSILQQLLALYFTIIYSWQLSSSEKSIMGKKFIHMPQGFYRFRFLFLFFFFSFFFIFFDKSCLPCRLHKDYAVLSAANRCVGSETSKHNTFDQLWKFKIPFLNFFQETHNLSFGGTSNYLYLFKNCRQTFWWPGERLSSRLKVTKMWFDPNKKYLWEPSFADFCWREGFPCWNNKIIKKICLKIWSLLHHKLFFLWLNFSEAATHRCSYEKLFWKYAANLQENTHAQVRFQ